MSIPKYTSECPDGMSEKRITITTENTDGSGHMSASRFAWEMGIITAEHLTAFGLGFENLKTKHKTWVVAWNSIQVNRLPKIGETVIFRIWSGKTKAGLYPHKYACYTKDGEPLAGAAALYLLMDSVTRKMTVPSKMMKQIPVAELENEPELPRLRMSFPKTLSGRTKRTVLNEDIDQNGHMNNTRYLSWAEHLLHCIYQVKKEILHIWIQYKKELFEGEQVIIEYEAQKDSLFITGYSGNTESFSCVINFKE